MKAFVGTLRRSYRPPALPVATAPPESHLTLQLRIELQKGRDPLREVQADVHIFAQQTEALGIVQWSEKASNAVVLLAFASFSTASRRRAHLGRSESEANH